MTESQNIEYKQAWRDDYLKWICGFANAQGGKIFIGMDDLGEVTGVDDYKKLMEDIPNKAVNHLGLMIDVNHHKKGDKHYIEIDVPVSSVPIPYHGIYHYRSGSTKQELKGVSLQNWLLKKIGKHWEDIPASNATFDDLDQGSIKFFLNRAITHKRIPDEAMQYDIPTLLESLHLLTPDGQPTQAAVLLFGQKPSQVYPMCSIKIGRFGKREDELLFQDVVETNLISMPNEVLRKLTDRYIHRPISYKGFERTEPLEYPESALREGILNTIVHKDYSSTWAFLRVNDDKLYANLAFPTDRPAQSFLSRNMAKLPTANSKKPFKYLTGLRSETLRTWFNARLLSKSERRGVPGTYFRSELFGGYMADMADIWRHWRISQFATQCVANFRIWISKVKGGNQRMALELQPFKY